MIIEVTFALTCSAVLLDKLSVKHCVKEFEVRFLELIDCTYDALVEKGIDVHHLHARLISLDVARKHEHQEFINSYLMNVDQGTTFNNFWASLGNYWNFLNFDLLEHVINKFGRENLKQKMESYKVDLQSFRKATRLCVFISCWPVKGEPSLGTQEDLREFVGKMKHDWNSCTLEDFEELKGVITHKFFLPEFALQLKEMKEGCITITWLIPVSFVKCLQEGIQCTNSELFVEQRIVTITIDGKDCYPYPTKKCVECPKEQYTPQSTVQPQQSEILPLGKVGMLPEKHHSFREEVLLKTDVQSEEVGHTSAISSDNSRGNWLSTDSGDISQGGMKIEDALKEVLQNTLIHGRLVRGLRETVKTLDKREGLLCVLAKNCSEVAYARLVEALCKENHIKLLKVNDKEELAKWVGLCKIDEDGKPIKVAKCNCVVIKDIGVDTEAWAVVQEHINSKGDAV